MVTQLTESGRFSELNPIAFVDFSNSLPLLWLLPHVEDSKAKLASSKSLDQTCQEEPISLV